MGVSENKGLPAVFRVLRIRILLFRVVPYGCFEVPGMLGGRTRQLELYTASLATQGT